ncbi:MAG: hypothetical protein IT581_14300 [Verrucomicrobiales bacterium]|nr:hypothetical protein [Verrucomicrobiales bacterium]
MNRTFLTAACLLSVLTAASSHALTVSGSVGGAPTGVNHLNFDDLANGSSGALTTLGSDGPVSLYIAPNARVATGSVSGQYAMPYISGDNGQGFASQTVAGPDQTPYLTSGRISDGGSIRINFASDQRYLGLLWGSVDWYNKLEFYNAANQLVATITGSDVVQSPNGDQGVNGTLYVNINDLAPFRSVVASATEFAFELDNVAYASSPVRFRDGGVGVPDGGSTAGILGVTVAGLWGVSRRRRAA